MIQVNLEKLIGRLNTTSRNALEAAAGLCLSRTHYEVEIEHFLLKLLDGTDNDLLRILRQFSIDRSHFAADLSKSLDRMKSGNPRGMVLSQMLERMFQEAWTIGSVDFGVEQVRSGLCVLAMAQSPEMSRVLGGISPGWKQIKPDDFYQAFEDIVAASPETAEDSAARSASPEPGHPAAPGQAKFLQQFTQNLTDQARNGKLDPVYGRDREIRQLIDILMRRRQNNPILTGEAGVGKTAVVEGFAMAIANGEVPDELKNVAVHSLDLTLLQAGAGVKGEFENRLKGLVAEVKASPTPIILFIDEAHTMIGAGGTAGQNDAANILKPALARGELRTIAATTWSEYKKYFERDAALARRFQVVKVDEPDEVQCLLMLRALAPALEKHHGVRILDEALAATVRLSHRFLTGRQLPDKAVSVLDTVCARLNIGQKAIPDTIQDLERSIENLGIQERILKREAAVGGNHGERLGEIAVKCVELTEELALRKDRWEKERALVDKIRTLRAQLEESSADDKSHSESRASLATLNAELAAMQGETPLVRVCADAQMVGEVISAWTGIPAGKMMKDEMQSILALPEQLKRRVIGQDHSLDAIAQRVQTSRANLEDPNRPVGVFMLVGPSGVGKTETALAIADLLYGGERNLITINMSEFQESHTVSTLKGAPPGYVGYGEGGVLTEAVRKRPYSVVLLDEVEKAHPDVLELFYQVFDKGVMEDGEGREIYFRNCIILLTSNAGSDTMMKLCADPETMPSAAALATAVRPELIKIFKPAFLGRMVVIPYYPVRDEALKTIVRLKLNKIVRRMQENNRIALSYAEEVVDTIASRCTEVESGARNVDNILTNTVLPELSKMLLGRMASGEPVRSVSLGVSADGSIQYALV
ncbi:MAG: type secretion ATPase, ClpV1 family [Candidatus Solibacter sp.]|nr:type secretion ATPase, ClpV1 family [Candidatus Solibacter sp.]